MYRKIFNVLIGFILAPLLVFGVVVVSHAQKLTPEEIIAKHVASIGKSDVVANSKQRMAIGSSEFLIRMPAKKSSGRAVLASNGTDMAFFSTFDMRDYPMERIGLFGNKIDIPAVELGHRSPLGSFLMTYDKTLGDHIFGGSVFSTWLFLNPEAVKGRLETEGKKKIGDRDAWVVKYSPKGGLGPGSYIKLYFDAVTFQHMRTVYRQKETEQGFHDTSPSRPIGDWSADMASNGSTLTEDFDHFSKDGGLMLPHRYTILLNIDGIAGTSEFKWNFEISEYRLIKDFPAAFFSFGGQS